MSDLLGQSRVRRAVLPRCKSDHARSRQRETSSRSRTRQSGHRPRPSNARGGQRQGREGDCRRTAGAHASRTEKRPSVRQHHGDAGEVTLEDERLARAISELPGVKRGRRDMVHKGVQELSMAAAQLRLGHGDATAKLRVALQGVLDHGLDGEEDGYYSSEDEDEINPETAAKGLGSAGRVHVREPLWRRLVPQDLLRAYEKHAKARGGSLKSHCTKLPLMMRARRVDARGVKRTHLRPTSRAFLRPKNRQKCRMILDASPINGADPRRPQNFTLPGLEQLRDWMRGGGGGGAWMAKLDLQNAFWSVVLPRGWRRVFVLQTADGRSYRYTRLPFGWRYSPLICQSLFRGIVAAALRGVRARAWVYIDDSLVTARSPSKVRRAVRLIIRRLQRAGFTISQKSETTPTSKLIRAKGGIGGWRIVLFRLAWVCCMPRGIKQGEWGVHHKDIRIAWFRWLVLVVPCLSRFGNLGFLADWAQII